MGEIIPKLRASARGSWRAEVILTCSHCGKSFDRGYRISATRAAKGQYCSAYCQSTAARTPDKQCGTCGKMFWGRTKFCSVACVEIIVTDEGKARRLEGLAKARQEGRIPVLSGEDNPNWKGGREASWERRRPKAAILLKKYRRANPDKVREFSKRRKGRKLDKLAYGSLPRIRKAQRNKCAICRASLRDGDHIDHIVPLARGGKHVARNLQLLCQHCNLTKSGRDPIDHMRSLGRLL